jgi:regulator of replication initiation timing
MGELESLMDQVENSSKSQQESVSVKLHEMQAENSALKVENERLKVWNFTYTHLAADS